MTFDPQSQDGIVPLDRRFLHVNMDVIERCNLRCKHCPYVNYREQLVENATISREFLAQLEEQVFPYAGRVSLSSFHEPLMAPEQFIQATNAVNRCHVPTVDVVTNGLLLEEDTATFMLQNIDLIRISADGATAATYEDIRQGGSFDLFMQKMEALSDLRKNLALQDKTRITLTACIVRRNVHEAVKFVELVHRLGFDWLELRLAKISTVVELTGDDQICHAPQESDSYLAKARKRAAELGQGITLPPSLEEIQASNLPRPKFTNCLYPWREVQISPQGGVIPCCMWHSTHDLGNMKESSFEEVWNGEHWRRLRWEFESSKLSRPGCIDCEVHFNIADPRYWRTYQFD